MARSQVSEEFQQEDAGLERKPGQGPPAAIGPVLMFFLPGGNNTAECLARRVAGGAWGHSTPPCKNKSTAHSLHARTAVTKPYPTSCAATNLLVAPFASASAGSSAGMAM